MNIYRVHLVTGAQCNTHDRILYKTTDSANSSQFLPASSLEPLLSEETELYTDMLEVPLEGARGTLHNTKSFIS